MASDSESDFYGDESTVSVLEARLGGFSPAAWWASELARRRGVLQVGQDESTAEGEPSSSAKPEKARRAGKLHNPYEGVDYAWQLTETVDAFLSRLPPSTTPRLESKRPWIYICNPYIGGRRPRVESRAARLLRECGDEGPEEAGSSDLATFYQGGMERLHILSSFLDNARRSNTSAGKRLTSDAEMNRERASAVKDILELARMTGIKTGKWMLFPPTSVVDDVWAAVAHATANNELGIAAKVEPAPAVRTSDDGHGVHHSSSVSIKDELSDEDENVGRSASQRQPADRRNDPARLVAVYTADFSDVADVARVLRGLRDLGLVRPGKGLGREIYYKTDAFTYLGISSGNVWGLPASTYSSGSILTGPKK